MALREKIETFAHWWVLLLSPRQVIGLNSSTNTKTKIAQNSSSLKYPTDCECRGNNSVWPTKTFLTRKNSRSSKVFPKHVQTANIDTLVKTIVITEFWSAIVDSKWHGRSRRGFLRVAMTTCTAIRAFFAWTLLYFSQVRHESMTVRCLVP